MKNTDNNTILSTKGLSVHFGGLIALDKVDIDIKKGEIHGLIGPNGAGKTTFTNAVSGLVSASGGEIRFKGIQIRGLSPHIIAGKGISRTFQKAQILPDLSCIENVMTGCHSRIKSGMTKTLLYPLFLRKHEEAEIRSIALELLDFTGLSASAGHYGRDLPWVECQLLQIARSLASEPELIILDEPTAGMGYAESGAVGKIIQKIRDKGITVVLISHDVKLVMDNADRVTVLDFGQKICEGDPDTVKNDPSVLEAYLGRE